MQINEPQKSNQIAQELGLSEEEFEMIKEQLGRTPNLIEVRIYSAMWSERSSSKNALHWLKSLPSEGAQILPSKSFHDFKLIDIGKGLACAVHIHSLDLVSSPSNTKGRHLGPLAPAYFPFASLGTVPMATLFSMRADIKNEASDHEELQKTAVQVSSYNNTLGIPTINGDLYLHSAYRDHPIFNLFSIALTSSGNSVEPAAIKPGQAVFFLGNSTTANSSNNPLSDQQLLNSLIEGIRKQLISGIQANPIGGLGRTAALLSWKAKTGIRLQIDQLFSSTEETLPEFLWTGYHDCVLFIGKKEQEDQLKEVFEKWEVPCFQVGELTDTDQMEIYLKDQCLATLSPSSLILESNTLAQQQQYEKPAYLKKVKRFNPNRVSKPSNYLEVAKRIWGSPNIISRRWLFEQFDSTLGNNTLSHLFSDAALLRIKGSRSAIALSSDCNPHYVYADPYIGAMIAFCEAARNITCSGAVAMAVGYSLHFGDPEHPEDNWQFVNAIKGLGDACRKFEVPVVGGDVRFNDDVRSKDPSASFLPTPLISMIGLVDDTDNLMTPEFKEEGHQIYMLGTPYNDFASSEYLRLIHDIPVSPVPKFELDEEYHNLYNLKIIIRKKLIKSAHDISMGGLMTALLRAALPRELGFDIETDTNFRKDAYLFGESPGRIVVSVSEDNEDELVNYLNSHNVSFSKLGEVTGRRILVDNQDFGLVKDWKATHEHQLHKKLDK